RQTGPLALFVGISSTVGAARHYCRARAAARQARGARIACAPAIARWRERVNGMNARPRAGSRSRSPRRRAAASD
ncbi:hypothetical protein, partial [Burkholderia pseudomallei]|uniref:hypothetical protein n=1 Tax=Burkholderia pseudomallei TaxID=28450 RepID=UPI0029307ECF